MMINGFSMSVSRVNLEDIIQFPGGGDCYYFISENTNKLIDFSNLMSANTNQ